MRKLTQQIKFSLVDQTKMITAASELSRNTVVYGGGGEMRWEIVTQGIKTGLRLRVRGQGPRHPRHRPRADRRLDLGLAAWASGLSGSKRLVNEFEIRTAVGEGTCVTVTRWK